MSLQPLQRIDIATTDPEEAHGYLRETYVDHSVEMTGEPEQFLFRHRITDGGSFFVASYEYAMDCRVETEPFGYLLIGQMLGGRLQLGAGRTEIAPARGEMFILDPALPMRIHWDQFHAGLVRIDLDVVSRVAAEVTGRSTPGGVQFRLSKALSAERVRNWQGLVRYLTRDFFPNETVHSSPLIHAQTVRLLAATALETFPNSAMDEGPARTGDTDPSAVRRAVAFMDEHAGEPIGVTDVATAARLGPRTLQDAFRRHLDTTPMSYLRDVRLERAHLDLQSADPTTGTTVADVATRWGFAHHGRFAALYRSRYGRAPSRTLHG